MLLQCTEIITTTRTGVIEESTLPLYINSINVLFYKVDTQMNEVVITMVAGYTVKVRATDGFLSCLRAMVDQG